MVRVLPVLALVVLPGAVAYGEEMFLTAAEVKDLTGYTYPARQIAWLKRKGYRC